MIVSDVLLVLAVSSLLPVLLLAVSSLLMVSDVLLVAMSFQFELALSMYQCSRCLLLDHMAPSGIITSASMDEDLVQYLVNDNIFSENKLVNKLDGLDMIAILL